MEILSAQDFDHIASELKLARSQIEAATTLLDEGNTIPFITRYRKERTGNLDEEQLRLIQERITARRQLLERAQTILRLIESQGKLTPELRREIESTDSPKRLEDLYLPFRPKKRSRASAARDRGLEPLANLVWEGAAAVSNLDQAAQSYINPAQELPTTTEVLQGVADLIAERIGDDAALRADCRQLSWQTGKLVVTATPAAEGEKAQPFRDYFDYQEAASRMPPHRILAINRGENEGVLRIKFAWDQERAEALADHRLNLPHRAHASFLHQCAVDALGRLIYPSLEREVRRELTERAEAHAVQVFARNLRNLLLQPPLRGRRVLAIDPGFRTGCKVAVLDEIGNCLDTDVVYLTGSADKRPAARQKLIELLERHSARLIVIGNGTACRETEELISEVIAETLPDLQYTIVNEAGASIYSTSTIAREEFPNFDATIRGTISIGRRLQDPLSELVKIEPQHIGVGMYQHDLNAKLLKESLESVVESCVNFVGVDLNTASPALLSRVSGLNQLTARRVVEWREKHGRFQSRQQLRDVAGVGEATFTQAAGFLKINGGTEPLDQTWIHPESYPVARQILSRLDIAADGLLPGSGLETQVRSRVAELQPESLATELGVGLPTLKDILDGLARPGRDPRTDLQGHVFKRGILKLEDLAEGMELQGTVLNVVDFGVFVDIGLKDSGLVHISRMSRNYVRSPHDIAAVGDHVRVWVTQIDLERRRVSLSMIDPAAPTAENADRDSRVPASRGGSREAAAPRQPAERQQGSSERQQSSTRPTSGPNASTRTQERSNDAAGKGSGAGRPAEQATGGGQSNGREPLRGFDELKQLWQQKRK